MRKNILYLFLFWAGCIFFLIACNEDNTQYLPPAELQITSSTVEFKSTGGEGIIKVDNANNNLKAVSNAEWCTITDCSQGVVSFTITTNTDMETRTAVISLTMGASSQKIGITQMGYIADYSTESVYSFAENKGFTQFIRFESELPIEACVNEEATSWLSYEKAEGGFNVVGTDNSETAERTGTITFVSGEMTKKYHFIQYSTNTFIRSWKVQYKGSDGFLHSDDITMMSEEEVVEISFKEYGISFKGNIDKGILNVPLGQYLMAQSQYKLYLGLHFGNGKVAIDPQQSFSLVPTVMEDGQWTLVPQTNGSTEDFESIAILAKEGDQVVGVWESFGNLSMQPSSEAAPPIKTYNIEFTSATGTNYSSMNDLIFKNDTYEIALETKGEAYKYLKSGTYVVDAADGYKIINDNLDYTYFKKIGEDKKLDLQSGEMILRANMETKKYEISMKFVLEDGNKVNATYIGEIEGKGFAIFDDYVINVTQVNQLERTKPNDPIDGQFYLKVGLNNFDIEMRLDFRAIASEKALPAGTYILGNDGEVGTLDSKISEFSIYPIGKYNQKFQTCTVDISQKDRIYTFKLDFTDSEGQRYVTTFSGEVKDMDNPK